MSNSVFDGPAVDLMSMLDARESRVRVQQKLLEANPTNAMLSATMNIPGEVKTSEVIREVFTTVIEAAERVLSDIIVTGQEYRDLPTGPEYYLTLPLTSVELKQRMIQLEQNHPWGRLLDLDVLWLKDGTLTSVSRETLNLPARTCFICNENAKDCGRSRRHSVSQMQQVIADLIQSGCEV